MDGLVPTNLQRRRRCSSEQPPHPSAEQPRVVRRHRRVRTQAVQQVRVARGRRPAQQRQVHGAECLRE